MVDTQTVTFSSAERWARGLALLAMVGLAAIAQWVLSHRGLPAPLAAFPALARLHAHPGLVGLAFYALALALLLVVLSDRGLDVAGGLAMRSPGWEVLLVLAVLVLAAWARLYRLYEVPPGLTSEEVDIARGAVEIVKGARPLPWQLTEAGVPWAYPYYVALFYWLLGAGYLTIKLPAVVGGLLAVIPLYLLAREMTRPAVAIAVIALYATARWAVNIARWGHVNALTPFFVCLVLWLLWRGIHTGRWRYWIAGGLALGLSQYAYPVMRVLPVITVLFIGWRALAPRGYLRGYGNQVLAFYAIALLIYAPLGWVSLTHLSQAVANDQARIVTTAEVAQPSRSVWRNALLYARAFHYQGDTDPRRNLVGAPQLEGITAALLVLGLGYALARWRRPESMLLLIWVAVFLVEGIFAPEAPDTFRVYGMLPALLLLCGLALEVIWGAWERVDRLSADHLAASILVAMVAWAGLDGVTTYFGQQGWQPEAWRAFAAGPTQAALYLRWTTGDAPESWHVYLSRDLYARSPVDLIEPGLAARRLILPEHVPLPPEIASNVMYLLDPSLEPAVSLIERYYPEARLEMVRDGQGRPLFMALAIPAEAATRHGLQAFYWQGMFMAGRSVAAVPLTDPLSPSPESVPIPPPYAQRLVGGLRLTEAGQYRFRLGSVPGAVFLYLNDELVAAVSEEEEVSSEGPPMWLPAGVLPIRLDRVVLTEADQQPLRLEWWPPGADGWQPLPPDRLLPVKPLPRGLIAAYYEGDRFSGQPVLVAIDPLLVAENAGETQAYAVRWLGSLDATWAGEYQFQVRSDDGARLYLDGRLVVDLWGLHEPLQRSGTLRLSPGRVPLELRYFNYDGPDVLKVQWSPPRGAWQPLRQAILRWSQDDVRRALTPASRSAAVGIPTVSPTGAPLGDLPATRALGRDRRWPHPQRGENYRGRLLKIGDTVFDDGLGTFGPTEIAFDLRGAYTRLRGAVGVDRDTIGDGVAWFQIELDGRVIWESGPWRVSDPPLGFDLDVTGGGTLVLRSHEGQMPGRRDAVDWVDLQLTAR